VAGRATGSGEPVEGSGPAATEQRSGISGGHPRERDRGRRGAASFLRELPVLIVLALGLAILLKTFVAQAFFIPSGSMEPTLFPGDRVLVQKVLDAPSRGDVIVFADPKDGRSEDRGVLGGFLHWLSEGLGFARPEHEDFIKRVIGLPGRRSSCATGSCSSTGFGSASPTCAVRWTPATTGRRRSPRTACWSSGTIGSTRTTRGSGWGSSRWTR